MHKYAVTVDDKHYNQHMVPLHANDGKTTGEIRKEKATLSPRDYTGILEIVHDSYSNLEVSQTSNVSKWPNNIPTLGLWPMVLCAISNLCAISILLERELPLRVLLGMTHANKCEEALLLHASCGPVPTC